jgi:hypothetical protein
MKKKEDARLAVLREYDRWAKDHPNDAKKMGGYVFFTYLEKERPDLLDFRAAWQQMANRSPLASSRRSIERLMPYREYPFRHFVKIPRPIPNALLG